MLGYYAISLTGTAHLSDENGICQDASGCRILENGMLVAVAADGLGSSLHSDIASKAAVNTVMTYVSENLPPAWYEEEVIRVLREAFGKALDEIGKCASENGDDVSEYDTTLTAVIYNSRNIIYAHVGDGGVIALSPDGKYDILTHAQKGDEFNVTTPLRAGESKWTFGRSEKDVCAFAIMTDGLFDVAAPWILSKTDNPVYVNFIRSFIDNSVINALTPADFASLDSEIRDYLSGDDVSGVTDDKTVVGVINTDITPAMMDESYYAEPDFGELLKAHRRNIYGTAGSGLDDTGHCAGCNDPAADEEGSPGGGINDKFEGKEETVCLNTPESQEKYTEHLTDRLLRAVREAFIQ